jgi:ferritin-like metal-binding protein YciE
MTGKEMLISWLNDAHGMENGLVKILEHQIKDAQDYPQMKTKLEQHLEQTRRHAQLVQSCVEALGGKTSAAKTVLASLFGQVQALSTGMARDEILKNTLADYAAECYEVACYTSIIEGAKALGEQQTVNVCQQILQEDEEMASWLYKNLPATTQQTLQQAAGSR